MVSLDDDHFFTEEITNNHTTSEKLEHIDLLELLQKLPEKYSQALTLFYLEQKSYEEAAELMAVPLGTFKATVHRAKKKLFSILNSTPKPPIT
jgi:RNA polymerase sigma-70 factor (ECF subfamily)